jgi:biotin carboxyl carrier protein
VKLRITLEGKTYDVDVEVVAEPQMPPGTGQARPPGPLPGRGAKPLPPASPHPRGRRPHKADDKICRSGFAGVVISVAVSAGQSVERGDLLMVIEAMKMETKIAAEAGGVVKAVRVAAGDAVKPGQILMEFE